MQYPQILVYENDGLLAAMLRETAKAQRWALREPRKPESCLRLLRSLCPSVLVLKMASSSRSQIQNPKSEIRNKSETSNPKPAPSSDVGFPVSDLDFQDSLELLANVHEQFPDAAAVVVGNAEDVALTDLAWDLGASYVLPPSQSRQLLPEIVVRLMQEAIRRSKHEM
jgi:DNA-binding NarL/FixJ family response regulator